MVGKERVLMVEAPDFASVDFLDQGVIVKLSIQDGKLTISGMASHGENSSYFDCLEHEFSLPEYKKAEEPDYSEEEEEAV